MKVKSFLKDVGGASRVTKRRQQVYDGASAKPQPFDPIGAVAKALHPGFLKLTVSEVRTASPTAKTIRFTAPHLPYFKAGQFLTLVLEIGTSRVTRPYSISSAPKSPSESRVRTASSPITCMTMPRPATSSRARSDWASSITTASAMQSMSLPWPEEAE